MKPSTLFHVLWCFSVQASPPSPYGKLLWSDEFNGTAINANNWKHQIGHVGPGLQRYTDSPQNSFIHDGHLVIQALIDNGNNGTNASTTTKYTSARLTSDSKVSFKFGRVEARIQMPQGGRGSLPAFWMLGSNFPEVGWPTCGEIDIMEWPGYEKTHVHATVHSKHITRGKETTVVNASSSFHVYGMEWSDTALRFYADNNVYQTVKKADFLASCGNDPMCWPFSKDFYFILTNQIGSPWGARQGIDNGAFPMQMRVDWVRVYELASEYHWVLKARTAAGQKGCSEKPTWAGLGHGSEQMCEDFCGGSGSNFVEFHESVGWCACFMSCDFSRPPSAYGSPANVYERVPSIEQQSA